MVYVAFNENDEFWQSNSKVIFNNEGINHLKELINVIEPYKVNVYETDFIYDDSVLYYTGHGMNSSGKPVCMKNADIFVQFLLSNNINVDRIVFLSCYTYNWLCKNYRKFTRLLSPQQPTIQLEGSRGSLLMRNISPIVHRQLNSTHVDFDGIRLTIDSNKLQDKIVIEGDIKRRYDIRLLSNTDSRNRIWVIANKRDFDLGYIQIDLS